MTTKNRKMLISVAGAAMLLLALATALLPMASHISERVAIGSLLAVAGLIEIAAVWARRGPHFSAAIAAGASLVAGLRLALDPSANFFAVFNLVILWLVVRSAALLFSGRHSPSPQCNWIYMAAAVDFLLALLLLAGLPVTVLVYGLFGQTSQILATFAWILAASFVAAGLLLLVAAPVEARKADQPEG